MYVGALGLALALAALADAAATRDRDAAARRRRFATLGLAIAAVVAILIAFGRHAFAFDFLRSHLPGFAKTRWPTQSLGVATAAIGLLAGIGLDACARSIARDSRRSRLRVIVVGVLSLAGTAALLWAVNPGIAPLASGALEKGLLPPQRLAFDRLHALFWRGDLVRAGLIATVSAIILMLPARRWWAISIVAAVDLAMLGRVLVPYVPGDLFEERPRLGQLAILAESGQRTVRQGGDLAFGSTLAGARNPAVFREARRVLMGSTALLFDIPAADGQDPMRSARNNYLLGALSRKKTPEEIRERLARVLGVTWIVEPSAVRPEDLGSLASVPDSISSRRIYSASDIPLPFAYLVSQIVSHPTDDEQITQLCQQAFDPQREAVVTTPIAGWALNSFDPDPIAGSCQITRPKPERIDIVAAPRADALLVIRESYDPGWKAAVDGVSTPIVRTNVLFMGVPLRAGEHRVELQFSPRVFQIGALFSAFALAILVGLVAWPSRRTESAPKAKLDAS